MKCPICNKALRPVNVGGDMSSYCDHCDMFATNPVWKVLAQTKEKLKIAKKALKTINEEYAFTVAQAGVYEALQKINKRDKR